MEKIDLTVEITNGSEGIERDFHFSNSSGLGLEEFVADCADEMEWDLECVNYTVKHGNKTFENAQAVFDYMNAN